MLAVVFAVMLQQAVPAATGQVVWETQAPTVEAAPVREVPPIPDSARADPYGYERAECSPLIRKSSESMEVCQQRVRVALAANLGAALPAGLAPVGATDECRQEAAGNRYALQCGAPQRADRPTAPLQERTCETRPRAQANGGVAWTEECRPESGRGDDGLTVRLGAPGLAGGHDRQVWTGDAFPRPCTVLPNGGRTMLLILMVMAIQTAETPIEVPDSALRDPYGFILSHCSPLVRSSSESLAACENRVGMAVRTRLPSFEPRPLSTTVASASDDPAALATGTAFGGRCTTRQDSQQRADGSSSSSGTILCGDASSPAARVLERLLGPD